MAADPTPAALRHEWAVMHRAPGMDEWAGWSFTYDKTEAMARQRMKDAAAEYPHYEFRIRHRTITEEWVDA